MIVQVVAESSLLRSTGEPELRWFAVNTHPASEQKASIHLGNQGWQTFLPRVARSIRSGRRVRNELRPLFPGYIFVSLDLARDPWRSVDSTVGVRSLVKHGETPAAVPVGVVEAVQELARDDGQVVFSNKLQAGDRVRFLAGPFADMIGALERLDGNGRVLVLLDLLGRVTRVTARSSELLPLR